MLVLGGLFFNSCTDDLDTEPIDPDEITSAVVFDDEDSYIQVLAKCYAGLAVSGQEGPAGNGDISGIDEGFGQYLRGYFYHQEFTTDEALIGWDDATIKDFHTQSWTDGDGYTAAMYYRVFYQISLCNEYLRQTTDDLLSDRGVGDVLKAEIATYRAEVRWLRALSYWHALDMFGSVPFAVETDPVGDFFPTQISETDLFAYIESELLDIEDDLVAPRANDYGRVDQAAAWMLLSKLYLNAEVYGQDAKYTDALTYVNKVIASSYALAPTFQQLFWANNDQDAETMQEIIFPIRYDGLQTQTWGGTNFIIHAGIGGDMVPGDYGVDGGWGGIRVTPEYVDLFDDEDDSRAMFFTEGQEKEIENVGLFTDGYAYTKFRNLSYDDNGDAVAASSLAHVDTDFPMFRLGDAYLMYAEIVARGAGGDASTAANYVNELRDRVGADNINSGQLSLDFVLAERGRELGWECHRRTDLRRFGKLTGGEYVWSWKGNSQAGRATESKYDQFPLPAADVNSNPNLTQNPNY